MTDETANQRRLVHFGGHVQGVGFRYTTVRIAALFRVTGYVQNLSDGRVRVVAEGAPAELDRFIGEIRAQMSAYIRELQCDTSSPSGEFDGFDIRY